LTMRILGIDPGLERTGYGVIEAPDGGLGDMRLVEAGVIRTRATDDLAERLAEIHDGLEAVFTDFRPDAVAIEQLYSHYKFAFGHQEDKSTEKLLTRVVNILFQQREAARNAQDFETADAIRAQLDNAGITIEDTSQGPRWRRKQRISYKL